MQKKKSPANPWVYWTLWRRRWDSNPRYREVQLISSFIAVCYIHGFSCQFQSALYARNPAWNLDFLKQSPVNAKKSPIGSNQRFFRFWKELRKERKEQKSKDNTRTVRMPTKIIKIWGVLSWKKTQSTGTLFPMWSRRMILSIYLYTFPTRKFLSCPL